MPRGDSPTMAHSNGVGRGAQALSPGGVSTRILVVDDEPTVSEVVERYLNLEGFEVRRVDRPENPIDIFTCPADIPPELDRQVQTVALDAYRVLACRDWSRVDVRLDADGRPRIIELNPLPGILPFSTR